MTHFADRHHTDWEFNSGDWVYVKLQPHRQVILLGGKQHKLSPKYYGPFAIEARVGQVAYKLKLPATSQVHPVFHVSQIKRHYGNTTPIMGTLPHFNNDDIIADTPLKILARKMVKHNNRVAVYGLIQWVNGIIDDATWKPWEDIAVQFPDFDILSNDS
ncbi:uncharacterized protein [Rutidosis leptorrhynchoides]|uniref:uncharacterized protein n=1 Tax=Rutidosis leptorrhynchoides TaxID=125765 RepID=UPI003A9A3282